MARLEININKLSPEERLDLIEELWDSLSADPSKIPLTDAQAIAVVHHFLTKIFMHDTRRNLKSRQC